MKKFKKYLRPVILALLLCALCCVPAFAEDSSSVAEVVEQTWQDAATQIKAVVNKHSGKHVLSGLLVCSECGSPYRRVLWMPGGERRYVWRCINRLEHGRRICKHSATLEEPELHSAVTSAMNELFRQRTAKEVLSQCVAAVLAGKEDSDLTLPAVESRLKALQEEQMNLLQMAYGAGSDCTEFDDRISQINSAMTALLDKKAELIREGRTDTGYDSRVQTIADTLEGTDSTIGGFDDGMVYQTVSSIKVLDRERLSIRFKDGTELEQEIINRRVSA